MNETIEIKETVETAEQEAAKPYTFRKLCAKDVFPMITIIKKIGLKDFVKFFKEGGLDKIVVDFFAKKTDNQAEENAEENAENNPIEVLGMTIAVELAEIIFDNLEKCEGDIFKLLASVAEMDVEDVRNLGLADFAEMVIDFFKKEDFKDFIKVVSKSFK